MAEGQVTHIDLPSDDLARAVTFYKSLFGWQTADMPEFPGYEVFATGQEGIGIGLRGETAPNQPRVYLTVESIDAALARLDELGGSVVVEKTEVPGMGWYAAINDTEGNEIGIWENLPG